VAAVTAAGTTVPAEPWTLRRTAEGELARITVVVSPSSTTADRDELLTSGVVEVMAHLVAASADASSVVVDLQLPAARSSAPTMEAFSEAVRGLIQSLVLESDPPVRPVNLVVTTPEQEREREQTLAFLASDDGRFSCGARFDLREAVR
jgi:hypothetical protein